MRPFEVVLVLLTVILALLAMQRTSIKWRWSVALTAISVMIFHLVLDHPHWQMLPEYIAFLAVISLGPVTRNQFRTRLLFPLFAILFAATSVAALMVFPLFTLPAPTGPYAVGTRTLNLEDMSRPETEVADPAVRRKLVVQVWYPAEPSKQSLAYYRRWKESSPFNSYQSVIHTHSRTDATVLAQGDPFPVIIFNEGWRGRRTAVTYLMEDLASHGYIAVAIDYPYIARRVEMPDGHVIQTIRGWEILGLQPATTERIQRLWNEELRVWAADQSFVLNTLQQANLDPSSPWYRRVNTEVAGAFGHSFGGDASIYASSKDSRIRAAANLDGPTYDGIRYRNSSTSLMLISGSPKDPAFLGRDATRYYGNDLGLAPQTLSAQTIQNLNQYGGYTLQIKGAEHGDFLDEVLMTRVPRFRAILLTSDIPPVEIQTIMRSYLLAFFNKALLKKNSPLLDPQRSLRFPEVMFRQWPAADATQPQVTLKTVPDSRDDLSQR